PARSAARALRPLALSRVPPFSSYPGVSRQAGRPPHWWSAATVSARRPPGEPGGLPFLPVVVRDQWTPCPRCPRCRGCSCCLPGGCCCRGCRSPAPFPPQKAQSAARAPRALALSFLFTRLYDILVARFVGGNLV